MMIRRFLIVTAFVAFPSLAFAQDATAVLGQFDFTRIPGVSASPKIEINLNPLMLGFVSAAATATNPDADAVDILAGLQSVSVVVYEIGEDGPALLDFVDAASAALEEEDWQRVVYVHEDGEEVRIYAKFDETRFAGLTLLVVEGDGGEAVFANLAGDIDPAKLGGIARTLGMGEVIGAFDGISNEASEDTGSATE